jgi:hypothetical protein
MGRATRYPPKPKPKYLHEVRVGHGEVDQAWIWKEAERVGGLTGYRKRSPFWAFTIVAFDAPEKAAELERHLRRWRDEEELHEARKRPCPVRVRYEEAELGQYAVIWGLSTGIIRDVVQTYRRERVDCSSHGHPNWIAADVILAAAPSIGRDKARKMVDAMLAWVIARHASWFWTGLQGDRTINHY